MHNFRLEGLVHELESLPYAWGNESTNFFLREFKEYSVAVEDIEEEETGRRKVAKGGIDMARYHNIFLHILYI